MWKQESVEWMEIINIISGKIPIKIEKITN